MVIGIPKEIMIGETRVAITPKKSKILAEAGHKVLIENQAGKKSGYSDEDFAKAGASIETRPQLIYQADLVVKVKEPQEEEEYGLLKPRGIIFAFLHLPANPKLAKVLHQKQMAAIAYERVQLEDGSRPILGAMSKIAGKVAVREGLRYLKKDFRNILIVVLGEAGVVGQAAIKEANRLGIKVEGLDLPGKGLEIASPKNIERKVKEADLLIAAAAIPGKAAPKLVSCKQVSLMKPGSVIVDVAIDEGGCVETSKPTTYDNPIFVERGVIHYCVKNIPGIVPQISTPALTSATFPYILEIANKGFKKAIEENPALAKGWVCLAE